MTTFVDDGVDGSVGIDNGGDLIFLGHDPAGVGGDDIAVVVLIDLIPVKFFRVDRRDLLGGLGIERRRRDEDSLAPEAVTSVMSFWMPC